MSVLLAVLVWATTLVDTLLGLFQPTQGRILINGIDITDHPESLWRHVAYLPQEIFIIDGSVKRNIALGVPNDEIDAAQLDFAINQAHINQVINNLPKWCLHKFRRKRG